MSSQDQEEGNEVLITYLLSLLGVSTTEGDGKHLHYLAVDQYITDNLDGYTYAEIRTAFNMLLKGEFNHHEQMKGFKVFNKLDCILVSKVMECYEIHKRIALKIYDDQLKRNIRLLEDKKNELSSAEKEEIVKSGTIACFEHYKETGEIEVGRYYVFDVLENKKLLNRSVEYRNEVMERVKHNLKQKPQRKSLNAIEGLKNALEIQKNSKFKKRTFTKEDVISESKVLVMKEYFDSLISSKTHIKEVL